MSDQHSEYNFTGSAALYAACQSGDDHVQAAAYQTLWVYLYRIAWQVVNDQPAAEALAQECAQIALIRIHQRLAECNKPTTFRAWARQIVKNIAIDELRRRQSLVPLGTDEAADAVAHLGQDSQPLPGTIVLEKIRLDELRALFNQAPISLRSRRVILGRYLDDEADETLAQTESKFANQVVLPSHIQVTRAKNMAKLRGWKPLRAFLMKSG